MTRMGAPPRWSTQRAPAACASWVLLVSACACLSACEGLEISQRYERNLSINAQAEAFEQPVVGRVGVSLAAHNEGTEPIQVTVTAQARTLGDADASPCEALNASARTRVLLVGVDADGDPQVPEDGLSSVPASDRLLELTAPPSNQGQPLAFALVAESRVRLDLYAPPELPPLSAQRRGGAPIELTPMIVEAAPCPSGALRYSLLLDSGRTLVLLPGGAPREATLLLHRPCVSRAAVPGTCPGHEGPLLSEVLDVAPGQHAELWLSPGRLGVGNETRLRWSCEPDGCLGTLAWTFTSEALACRSTADCQGANLCTADGRCTQDRGCSLRPGPSPPPWTALLLLSLLLTRRMHLRSHRASWTLAVALSLLTLSAPGAHASDAPWTVTLGGAVGGRTWLSPDENPYQTGLDLGIRQHLESGRVGLLLAFHLSSYLVDTPAPPLERGARAVTSSLGASIAWTERRALWYPYSVVGVGYLQWLMQPDAARWAGGPSERLLIHLQQGVRTSLLAPLAIDAWFDGRWFFLHRRPPLDVGWGLSLGISGTF